jgi:23S rRNA pseudouridine1911/1915/1917 synthase
VKLQAGPEDRGQRLDVFLTLHLERVTRSHVQSLNRGGAIRVNAIQEKDGYRIRGSETIEVEMNLPSSTLQPHAMPLAIVYEDDALAVVEKPAGIVVHPGAATGNNTMVHGLLFHFQKLSGAAGPARPGIVHRLDKWTSGLLIVAKDDWTHAALSRAFQERRIHKTYIALVHGKLPQPAADIALSIGRHPAIRTRMTAQPARGRSALSAYRVLEEFKGFSLLEVKIMTGRTHQIRVHLSAIGHPVVGDNVYGESRLREFEKKFGAPGRYFLHAAELRFTHPKTEVNLQFQSPLPVELGSLLQRIRG